MNINTVVKYLCALIVLIGIDAIMARPAAALTMDNGNYQVQMDDYDMTTGTTSDSGQKPADNTAQTVEGEYTGTNYKVKAGFDYNYPFTAYSFTLSQTMVDFGILSATNPVIRDLQLTVDNPPPHGYQVLAAEDHVLLSNTGNYPIPDTSCDNGSCSDSVAAPWSSTLTYGFGYRCEDKAGSACDPSFANQDYYKEFPDLSKKEAAGVIMQGKEASKTATSQITYKVNISGTQQPGKYSNHISYIAAPGY